MAERVVRRKFCDLGRGAHVLAVVYSDRIVAREAVLTTDGVARVERTYAPVPDEASLTVSVTCPCGNLYLLDLAALWRGEEARLLRKGEGHSGVSHRRRRAGGR